MVASVNETAKGGYFYNLYYTWKDFGLDHSHVTRPCGRAASNPGSHPRAVAQLSAACAPPVSGRLTR